MFNFNFSRTTKLAALLAILAALSGCSTMEARISDEFKYGKVFGMQQALQAAAQNCHDEEAMFLAGHWVMIGIDDLTTQLEYIDENSDEYYNSRNLLSDLRVLSRGKTLEEKCEHVQTASLATHLYVAELTDRPVMMAKN